LQMTRLVVDIDTLLNAPDGAVALPDDLAAHGV
jgi:hypothetical protein